MYVGIHMHWLLCFLILSQLYRGRSHNLQQTKSHLLMWVSWSWKTSCVES